MKIVRMPLSDIVPADYNPRKKLKPGDKEYEALKASIERFGVAAPLVVNDRTGRLISGHQRLNVLSVEGAADAEVVLVDLDEDQEKLLNVAMNKIEGDWDYDKLQDLFSDISAEDVRFTGFDEKELDNLFGEDNRTVDFGDDPPNDEDAEGYDLRQPGCDGRHEPPQEAFKIFMSFPTRALAEDWLKQRGLSGEFKKFSRNVTIKMEGAGEDGA